jgi:hypothetical protein
MVIDPPDPAPLPIQFPSSHVEETEPGPAQTSASGAAADGSSQHGSARIGNTMRAGNLLQKIRNQVKLAHEHPALPHGLDRRRPLWRFHNAREKGRDIFFRQKAA